MKISILTGAVQSGKTTGLLQHIEEKKNISGVLTPVENGKRYFLNISNRETFHMEANDDEKEILEIGRFRFSAKAFKKAEEILLESIEKNPSEIIIDEIGPLELQGKGFANVLRIILQQEINIKLLLVIRDSKVDEVLNYFNIDKSKVNFIGHNSI